MNLPKIPRVQFDKTTLKRAVSLVTVALGYLLIVGGLFTIVLSASLPTKTADTDPTVQSVTFAMSQIPGIPLNLRDLATDGLTTIGLVSWIIGLNILFIGMGLVVGHRFAKWIAMGVFALATFFNFTAFLTQGVLGSSGAFVGIFINGLFVYLFSKLDA